MTTYKLILFFHVLSAFGILLSFGLEWTSLNRLQRSCTKEESREALKAFGILPRIGGPSFLIALLSGIYLWETGWRGSAWTVAALISLFVIAATGAVLTGPRMASMGKETSREQGFESLPPRRAMLWASLQIRTWMAIGIVFLMTMKPGVAASVVTMAVAILLGLAMNPATTSYYRRKALCALDSSRK